ncbi:MAG: hypothetical protein KTR20_09750 [Cellvibrionaceae bacterium]|nr:hypothetical protein [Cellvibrionaceae bacterium]
MSDTLELRNIEDLLVKPPENVDVDFIYTNHDRDPAWFRFLKGAYDMPITWWTGIIHCTMLSGIWGDKYKSAAQINQQRLDLALEKLASHPDRTKILLTAASVASYNRVYLTGRLAGGTFVTYAINKLLSFAKFIQKYSKVIAAGQFGFNLSMSSFGAALIAVASGYNSTHDVVYSIVTGTAQRFPLSEPLINLGIEELKEKAKDNIDDHEKLVMLIEALNDVQPSTMKPYDDWCKDNPDQANNVYFCQ